MQSLDLSLNRRRLHFRHFNPLMCRSPFCRVYRPTGYVAASVSCREVGGKCGWEMENGREMGNAICQQRI